MPLKGQSRNYEYEYFRKNDVDLIGSIEVNEFNENTQGLLLTNPYFTATKVLVGRKGESISQEGNYKIAIVGGSATLPYVIKKEFPDFEIITYDDIGSCLKAVKNKDADVLLYNQYLIERYLSRPQYDKMTIIPEIELEEKAALSPVYYSNEKKFLTDPLLISVINKSIKQINEKDINSIVIKHTVEIDNTLSLVDFCYKFRLPLAGILLLSIALCFMQHKIFKDKKKNMTALKEKNSQLADAILIANDASETKGRFLAQMSHEIRTPMNAVVGMTALAKKVDNNPQKTDEYLEKIEISSKLLLSIINDVLDMSAIEGKKLKIGKESFDLRELLNSISTVYYGQCSQKGIKFEMIISDLIEDILIGDSLRVNQILMNLVSNAYKFTKSGGEINVSVSMTDKKDDKIFLRFVVKDNGCGMSEDLQKRLFHAFEQENAQTAKKHGGSGLGLAITKNLVELMHGAIEVESEIAKGTTFTVDLPFKCADIKKQQEVICDINEESKEQDTYNFEGKKVLLAEDFELNREVAVDLLAEVNLAVECAEDGKEAVEMFEQSVPGTYDLILMDIQMPNMDGYEAAYAIRHSTHPQANNIPIFAMTANAFTEDISQALSAGMDGHISKPIDTDALYKLLYKQFSGFYTAQSSTSDNIPKENHKI